MGKIVFLDIDGTLMNSRREIPESTKRAVRLARERGNKLFLCTGRIVANIESWILELGFDGVVASSGAYVQVGDKVIFHQVLDSDMVIRMTEILREHHAAFYFQGADGIYISPREFEHWKTYQMAVNGKIREEFVKLFHVVDEPGQYKGLTGADYVEADISVEQLGSIARERLGEYFTVTGASFGTDQIYCGEVTRKGITKGSGMEHVVNYYGMTKEDTIAIGDGPNDFEMIQCAHLGIAMGNGVEELKKAADDVTDTIDQDGIWKAFEKHHLI